MLQELRESGTFYGQKWHLVISKGSNGLFQGRYILNRVENEYNHGFFTAEQAQKTIRNQIKRDAIARKRRLSKRRELSEYRFIW